jgi:hypothetical protein
MAQVYSVEVLICATAYILTDSEEEAAKVAQRHFKGGEDASTSDRSWHGDVEISGAQFDAEDFPEVSLSPAMTFCGAATALPDFPYAPITPADFECVHDDDEEAA